MIEILTLLFFQVSLTPEPLAKIFQNGHAVLDRVVLVTGSRIVLGTSHIFR